MRSSIKLAIIAIAVAILIIWILKIFNIAATPIFADMGAFFAEYGLAGVFIVTIAAGTIVPLGSPALVVVASAFIDPLLLTLVAATGFTIGMCINYGLAYRLGRPFIEKRISIEHFEEAKRAWSTWGWMIYVIFGLIPVLPVELLAFICGFLKAPLTTFILLSFLPRFVTFAMLAFLGQNIGIWLGVA
ncbi:MAG: VTT domain-containing protein [Candidatus Bathyarchaeota archaeon]|nr:VTT domain-containing protein [Candidatus Bathyarchaeota archaeon]